MSGVPLWRTLLPYGRLGQAVWTHAEPTTDVPHEDGRWFPEAEAAALVEIAEHARVYSKAEMNGARGITEMQTPLSRALDRLDAARSPA